ncbi:MAG TPA: DUF134 domain-containing protein [Feifaniaceae bacterium]|nr:DUF134 domain-containing protein [Feifaniaceae bacterium]
MPRPMKWRRVCCLPDSSRYGPLGSMMEENTGKESANTESAVVRMSVDEYETIRLIDLEGYTQEECAEHMNVSRSTIQGIYDSARKSLANSLVNGKVLLIEGGEYRLCDGTSKGCGGGGCHRHRCGRGFSEEAGMNPDKHEKETEQSNENSNSGQ